MTIPQRKLWDAIRISPEKWQEHSYNKDGNGFWAVGIIGNCVIWYNDIEEGFNRSTYATYGMVNEYYCNQDDLEWTVQHLLNLIKDGHETSGFAGPPKPLEEF